MKVLTVNIFDKPLLQKFCPSKLIPIATVKVILDALLRYTALRVMPCVMSWLPGSLLIP